jgi:hypothetical protein
MPKNTPIQKIEAWPLAVAIWLRQHDGRNFYSATLQRTYKDGKEYKHTDSLNKEDLLLAAKLLNQAETVIRQLEQADHAKKSQTVGCCQ